MAAVTIPGAELLQHLFRLFLVPDEIVINQENVTLEAQVFEGIELGKNLGWRLGAGHATVDFNNVAKLALEGTPARKLNGHDGVVAEVGNHIEPRELDHLHIRL